MKDNENNATKKKRFVDVDAIEKVIAELPLLARQGKIGIVNIQRALQDREEHFRTGREKANALS